MTALVLGVHRVCPRCKGRGLVVWDGDVIRPAFPSEVAAHHPGHNGRVHTCGNCKGERVLVIHA